jgi:hypothetical protein
MTYCPQDPAPRAGLMRRLLDRLDARRRAARRRADVERRVQLARRVWAVQIAATTAGATRRPEVTL